MSTYYYSEDSQTTQGPVNLDSILQKVRNGELAPEATICEVGTEDWFPVSSLLKHDPSLASAPRAVVSAPTITVFQGVIVKDIEMRFGSMVVFMIKWVVASIPAAIILFGFLFACFIVFTILAGALIGLSK